MRYGQTAARPSAQHRALSSRQSYRSGFFAPTYFESIACARIGSMEWLVIILLVSILALLGYLLWSRKTPQETQGMVLLQQRIQELERSMEAKLGEGANRMFE